LLEDVEQSGLILGGYAEACIFNLDPQQHALTTLFICLGTDCYTPCLRETDCIGEVIVAGDEFS